MSYYLLLHHQHHPHLLFISSLFFSVTYTCPVTLAHTYTHTHIHTYILLSQTTGDAISDFLLIETILRNLDWSVVDWNDLYRDLPCRQVKVVVSDRSEVETEDAERRCKKPQGLQDSIDAYVRKFGPNARSFVRPSGTENVVRIYAEAQTQEKADSLAEAVASRVKELLGTGL